MLLSEIGEFGLLDLLASRGLAQRIENDAAQLRDGLVVTQDALVEGVHFELDWTSWRDLGYKAAAVNISDLSASGALPEALIVSLGLPGKANVDDVIALYEGLNEARVPVLGGDTTKADRVYLSLTALGRSERVPGRGGARPGDRIVVTGPLGASGAGYLCLSKGLSSPLAAAHRRPPLRIVEGLTLAKVASAMLDLSDGVASDAGHIARRSGCKVVIDLENVPVAAGVAETAKQFGVDVWRLACGFGEDYELLAALPSTANAEGVKLHEIGRCEPGEGLELRLGGSRIDLRGWDHFH